MSDGPTRPSSTGSSGGAPSGATTGTEAGGIGGADGVGSTTGVGGTGVGGAEWEVLAAPRGYVKRTRRERAPVPDPAWARCAVCPTEVAGLRAGARSTELKSLGSRHRHLVSVASFCAHRSVRHHRLSSRRAARPHEWSRVRNPSRFYARDDAQRARRRSIRHQRQARGPRAPRRGHRRSVGRRHRQRRPAMRSLRVR